jgi:hypothetical protein
MQRATQPGLCTDAVGVDREDIHKNLSHEAEAFFGTALGMPMSTAGMQTAVHRQ